jgi:ABC-2 type transport system ATP-binding protein
MSSIDGAGAPPSVVVVDNVSKTFVIRRDNSLKERIVTFGNRGRAHREEFRALGGVSFTISAGKTIGLIGTNGSGKSTLLKIIGGIIDPSSGTVQRRGRLAALLELGAGFHPDLSGRDNIYLNAAVLGLAREQKFYSSGMYVRLAFAVAVHTDPDLLLVDEVLAVGDEAFQRKCMDKIRQFQKEGRTIVLVSHSASQVMEVCDEGIVLRDGEVAFIGSAADATRVHREILEGKRKRNAVLEEVEHEIAAGAAAPTSHVISVRVENEEGVVVRDAHPGQDLTIRVRVAHSAPVDEWNSGMSIDTSGGQQVFGTGTRRLGTSHGSSSAGETEVAYRLRDSHFAGGQYFVNVELQDAEGRSLDVAWQAAAFYVPTEHRQTGTVHTEVSVS